MIVSTDTREGPAVGRLRDEDAKLVLRYGWSDYEVQIAPRALALKRMRDGKAIVGALREADGRWYAWEIGQGVYHEDSHGIEGLVGVLRHIV